MCVHNYVCYTRLWVMAPSIITFSLCKMLWFNQTFMSWNVSFINYKGFKVLISFSKFDSGAFVKYYIHIDRLLLALNVTPPFLLRHIYSSILLFKKVYLTQVATINHFQNVNTLVVYCTKLLRGKTFFKQAFIYKSLISLTSAFEMRYRFCIFA